MMNNSNTRCLLDTNFLVAATYVRAPNHAVALEFFEKQLAVFDKLVISSQNVLELTSVLTNAFKLSTTDYLGLVEALISDPKIETIFPDHFALVKYFELLKKDLKVHTTDIFLAATALSHDVNVFITNDSDFGRVPGIKVINPFEN